MTYNKDLGSINEMIRSLRGKGKEEKHLILEEGKYYLDEAIRIGEADSGFCIEGKGDVQLIGGKRISNWYRRDGNFWAASLQDTEGLLDFRTLIVNGRFADRARYPEQGFLIHRSDFDVAWMSTYEGGWEREPTFDELTTLYFDPKDITKDFVRYDLKFLKEEKPPQGFVPLDFFLEYF